jgi:SAM-dependent methyltransferase
LELAAGTGIVSRKLRDALPKAAKLTVTDLNPPMLEVAAAKFRPGEAVELKPADATALPFADQSFDLIVCQFGVMFFPDRPVAFAEAARVLRPGGTLLFTVWDAIEYSELSVLFEQAVARAVDGVAPDFLSRIPHGYADPDRIRGDVVAGGLEIAALDRVQLRGRANAAADIAEGFCCGTPLRFQLAAVGDPGEIAKTVAADLTAQLGTGPVEGDLAAFVVLARRPE